MERIRKSPWITLEKPVLSEAVHIQLFRVLKHNLETKGDRTWLIDGATGKCILFSEVIPKVCSVAGALRRRGFRPGNLAAMYLSNRADFFIPVLAAWMLGGGVSMLTNNCVASQATRQLRDSRPKFLFCDEDTVDRAKEAVEESEVIEEIFIFGSGTYGVTPFEDLLSGTYYEEDFEDVRYDLEDMPAYLPYSSGTTGFPKGIIHTHKSLVAMCQMLRLLKSPGDVVFGATNMFHVTGFLTALRGILLHRKTVFLHKFSEEDFLRGIDQFKPSLVVVLPPVLVSLSKKLDYVQQFDLSSIEVIWTGSTYLKPRLEDQIRNALPKHTKLMQLYGMTENGFATVNCAPNCICNCTKKKGTIGLPAPYMEIMIADEKTGLPLGPNEKGEICTRSPCNFKGYLNNPTATAVTLIDGWIHSGDQGYYDQDGYFYFTDRLKDLIKYRGFHVVPALLDTIITSIPGVLDAAVVGIPDDENGELPHACVVRKDVSVTEDDIKEVVKGALSEQEQLRGGISFIPKIPRNDSLKVQRKVLLKHVMSKLTGEHRLHVAS